MKALEKDRTRRYETANGLARDIQRYLNDEVVEARPPSAAYRLKKYVRRHKGRVIAAVLVSATLLGGVAAVVGVQAVANTRLSASLDRETRANEDLAAANDELTRSRAAVQARYDLALDAIKTIHMGDSEEWFLKEERFKKLRDRRLKSAADFYVKLGALLGKETDAASRRALAQSNFELAKLTAKIGNQEAALEAHRAVLAVREALAAEPEADAGVKTDVGRSLTEVATLLDAADKTDEALSTYRRAETALSGPAKSDPAARAAQAACRSRIGQILFNMNKTAEALAVFEQARAAQEVLRLETGDSKESRRDLADTLVRIGRLQWYWADLEGARANYQRALMIMGTLADDDDIDLRNSVANVHRGLSGVLEFTGSLAGSELEARQALTIWQALFDENPAVTDFGIRLATCRSGLGRLLADMGRTSEAEIETRAALTLLQKLNNDNPTDSRVRYVSLIIHYNQGILLLQAGKPAEAEAECRTALETLREIVKESPSVTLYRNALPFYIDSLADVIRNRGRSAEAKTPYEETIALKEPDVRTYPKDPEHGYGLICSTWRRGQTLRDLGDPAGAAAETRRALGMCGVLPPRYHRYVFETACCHAALAGLAELKGSGVTTAEADKEAALALEWLRRAQAMGYCNVNEIRIESAFNSLRGREDFKKLTAEMAATTSRLAP
jgi:tetratricopeptide (TPR) repeat protein